MNLSHPERHTAVDQMVNTTHSSTSRHPRIALIDSDRNASRESYRILRAATDKAHLVESPGELENLSEYSVIVANYDSMAQEDLDGLFQRYAGLSDKPHFLLYSSNEIRRELSAMFGERALTNLLGRDSVADASSLWVTIQKFLRGDIFGIDKYFSWGARKMSLRLSDSEDLEPYLHQMRAFVEPTRVPRRIMTSLLDAAEELMTNAVYNAPVSRDGTPRFANRSRTDSVHLDDREAVELELRVDGRQLGISVADPFGSLPPELVTRYLAKCFRKEEDQIDAKDGGAGLGLYYAFEKASHLVVNIEPKTRTELIALVNVRHTYREFAGEAKSFNMFVCGGRG